VSERLSASPIANGGRNAAAVEFWIGSVSKLFTALAILQPAEDGGTRNLPMFGSKSF
jgi:hypothetical protein